MNIYERFGRLQEQYTDECERHQATLAVLGMVSRGQLAPRRVMVSDDNQAWQLMTEAAAAERIDPRAAAAEPLGDVSARLPDDLVAEGVIAPPATTGAVPPSERRNGHHHPPGESVSTP